MTVDSYRNFRLRVKYIGVARMLQGIHSFLTLTDRTGAYFLYIIIAAWQRQCIY